MEINGNGYIKRIKNILAIIISLGVISASVWGYVENRIASEIEISNKDMKVYVEKEIAKKADIIEEVDRKVALIIRREQLVEAYEELEILLNGECDKEIIKKRLEALKKVIGHIDKKLTHDPGENK